MGGNLINGTLPDSRSTLTNMDYFNIVGNFLTGTLPDSRSTWTGISYFNVQNNEISGILPDSRSSWTNISSFIVVGNFLTGTLPSSRSAWTGITFFNALNNDISGSLPTSRSSWTSIIVFLVGNNQINGTLPASRSTWTTVNFFYVGENEITGTLPDSRSAWSTTISTFNVTFNLLTGLIPGSWYLVRPDLGSAYIEVNDNCMQTTGYSVGMQSWVSTNVIDTPQNDCNVIPPVILSPTNAQVLTTGNIVINGTGQSGNSISVTLNGITMTGIIDGSGLRSFLFTTMSDNTYIVSAFQTDYLTTYNSDTVTRSFSIAIPLPPVPTPIPTPSPSGGGGGGGAILKKDDCSNGDSSPSYYDKDCGKASIETTPEPKDPTFMEQCQYNDGEFELYKTTMTDIKGMPYEQAVITLLTHCLIHGEANKGTSYKGEERLRYGALYKIVYRLVGKPIDIPTQQKHWSDIYYIEGKKLGLRKDLSVPKDPNMVVGSRALQKVVHNIFDYRALNNPSLEASLKNKIYSSLLVKRGTFATIIAKLINK